MNPIRVDLPAIQRALTQLKASYPRKRGVVVRIAVTVETPGYGRQHRGFATWNGTRKSLQTSVADLIGDADVARYVPLVFLYVTHAAIADSEYRACIDITRFVLPGSSIQ